MRYFECFEEAAVPVAYVVEVDVSAVGAIEVADLLAFAVDG